MIRGIRAGAVPKPQSSPGPGRKFSSARGIATSAATGVAVIGVQAVGTIRSAATGMSRAGGTATCRSAATGFFAPRALGAITSAATGVAASTPTWYNGYSNYFDLLISKESVFGAVNLVDYPLLIDVTLPELKTVANGGGVQHASGYDIRVEQFLNLAAESGGAVLDYARRMWSATTGRLQLRVRVPLIAIGVDTYLRVYFGNGDVTTDQQNVGGAYAAYLLALDPITGVDLTGQGRSFTPANVTSGTLIGDAGLYNGTTSRAQLASFIAANGLSALTVEAWIAPGVTPNGPILSSGPSSATGDPALGFVLGYNNPGAAGGVANTVAFKLETSAGTTRVEAPAASQVAAGVLQFAAGTWQSGQGAKLFLGAPSDTSRGPATSGAAFPNGAFVTPSNTVANRTGTTLIERGGPTSVGYTPVGGVYFAGLIDEVCISARALTEAFLQTQCLNFSNPALFYSIGAVNAATVGNKSPIGRPIFRQTTNGVPIDTNVVALSADPEGNSIVLDSITGSGGGTTSIIGGTTARLNPTAAGRFQRLVTVKDGGVPNKLASMILMYDVLASTGMPKHVTRPPSARVFSVGFTGEGGAGNSFTTLEAAYAAVPASGDYLIETNNVTMVPVSGSVWNFDRTFTNDVIITSRNPLGTTLNGRIFCHSGRKHWLYKLKTTCADNLLNDDRGSIVACNDFKITHCQVLGCNGVYVISNGLPDTNNGGSKLLSNNVWIGWNDFIGQSVSTSGVANASHVKFRMSNGVAYGSDPEWDNFFVYWNLFNDPVGFRTPGGPPTGTGLMFNFYIGDNQTFSPDFYCSLNAVVEYNYCPAANNRRFLYFKRGVGIVRYNHCDGCDSEAFTQRHGWGGQWLGNRSMDNNAKMIMGGGRKPAPYTAGGTMCLGNYVKAGYQIMAASGPDGAAKQGMNYGTFAGNETPGTTTWAYIARLNSGAKTALRADGGGALHHFNLYAHTGPTPVNDGNDINGLLGYDAATCDVRPAFTGHGLTIPVPITLTAAAVGALAP